MEQAEAETSGILTETKEGQHKTSEATQSDDIALLHGVGPKTQEALKNAGINTVADILSADIESLSAIEGIGPKKAQKLLEAAKKTGDRE